tara:strand:- start:399 stop:1967 length:1569 start_codon:yes stop_codon:yes gene_type:complete
MSQQQNVLGYNNPSAYRLINVVISNNEGQQYDVTDLVDSFEISESIYDIFLQGSITLADNVNIFNRIMFTGQEYIRIHFCGMVGNDEEEEELDHINQVFRVYELASYLRDNQGDLNKTVYGLRFCSPLMYEAQTKRISQHFSGTNGQIINQIFKDHLFFPSETEQKQLNNTDENSLKPLVKGGKELGTYFSVMSGTVGETHAFLCPNWTVNKTLRYLRDHTSDPTEESMPYGDSYYLYQTCTKGFRYHNITSMKTLKYLDGGYKFEIRDSSPNIMLNRENKQSMKWDILDYNKINMYNTLKNHKRGLYSASVNNYNTVTKQLTTIDNEFTQQFKMDESETGKYTDAQISVGAPFRLGAESIRIPNDGGFIHGEVAETAPVGFKSDPITKRYGSAVDFDYDSPHKMSDTVVADESISDASISNGAVNVKLNRERVEALFATNRINMQIAGRTDLSCGMMIDVNITQTSIGKTGDELTHNGSLLIEGITWTGSIAHGLEMQLSCTSDGFNIIPDTFEQPEREDV